MKPSLEITWLVRLLKRLSLPGALGLIKQKDKNEIIRKGEENFFFSFLQKITRLLCELTINYFLKPYFASQINKCFVRRVEVKLFFLGIMINRPTIGNH